MILALLIAVSPVDAAALAASEVLLVLDAAQTLDIKRHPGRFESNPVLGRHPSDVKIVTYFAVTVLAAAAGFLVLPAPLRWVLVSLVIFVEARAVVHNAQTGISIRF